MNCSSRQRVDLFDEVGRLWLSKAFLGVTQLDCSQLRPIILESSAKIVAVVVRRLPEEAVVYSAVVTNPSPRIGRGSEKPGTAADKVNVASSSVFSRVMCLAAGNVR